MSVPKTFICPLCGEAVPYSQAVGESVTHVWKCQACPFVGFEFYKAEDYRNLASSLEVRDDITEAVKLINEELNAFPENSLYCSGLTKAKNILTIK